VIVLVSVIVVADQLRGQTGVLSYSEVSSTANSAQNENVTFGVLWADASNVSGYIFGCNSTGALVNDSWVAFPVGQSAAVASVSKNLTGLIGNAVSWTFWCNDSSNKWSSIPLQNTFVESDNILMVVNFLNGTQIVTGNITIQLYNDMPITSGNFRDIIKAKAYDMTIFHRVEPGFVIQGGDLTSKGISWPTISDELPNLHSNVQGALAMAKAGSDTANTQFFIDLNDTNAAGLDNDYSVFGHVINGMDVVLSIGNVPVTPTGGGMHRPVSQVTLVSARFVK
jgi:peptidylprolyl isomerase